jgi:hypothetical protein
MEEYRFVKEWNENDTTISWQIDARKILNKIIRKYNKWQYKHHFNPLKGMKLLIKIEFGKQVIGKIDGGSGYLEELEGMEMFVEKIQSERNGI